jgi:cysteine synthase A
VIFADLAASVGHTPLVELARVARGLPGRVLGKLEMRNPCGSVKDRVGVALVADAERRGLLRPGSTLVEATGGNTGIGLALAAAIGGYRLVLTMPESMSTERIALLKHLGAEVHLTPGILMIDAVARANELLRDIPGAVMLDQFRNRANPDVHRRTTAEEIWSDAGGEVDYFVSSVGTGGTLTGVASVLKARRPSVRVVAVEPAGAAILSGRPAGPHKIPGIGVGFIPEVLDRSLIDGIAVVGDEEAFEATRRLGRREGVIAGPSSGAALHAALAIAAREEARGKTIVVILPDSGERYITSSLFAA